MNEEHKMPIAFQMALAHNASSMNAFLRMSNDKQDEIIKKSQKLKTIREINNFVDSIPKIY